MDGQYEAVTELEAGAFGKVLLIENKANREEKYAMKMINLLQHGLEGTEAIVQEINLLASLCHEHVLEYVTCFKQLPFICIVTEYCPNGNLAEFVESRRGTKLSEYRLVVWFKQIGKAVEYLHSNKVIHRDLKLQNVFLKGDMDCVVGDLGVARVLQSQTDLATTAAGTYLYMSPEIFLGIPYNAKTDIWSLGVMMYELAALERPFNSFFLPLLIHQVTMGEEMQEKSKEVKTEIFNTTLLKGQFDEYKKHCMKVLQDDNILFKEASMALNKSGQKGNIQEKLLSILGEKNFKQCGVQLLYYKNIGHNLKKK